MEPSITDWIQAICSAVGLILTAAGLYYIYQTLKEQARVNEAQFRLLEIESNRAAREVRPILRVEPYKSESLTDGGVTDVIYYYKIRCVSNKAFGICIEYAPADPWQLIGRGDIAPGKVLIDLGENREAYFAIRDDAFKGPWGQYIKVHYLDVDKRELSDDYYLRGPQAFIIPSAISIKTAYPASTRPNQAFYGFTKHGRGKDWVSAEVEALPPGL